MRNSKNINTLSGVCFFLGALLYKTQYIPIPFVASILKAVALGLYLVGYILWAIAYFPETAKPKSWWDWFNEQKRQHVVAAVLGVIATLLGLASVIANPILLVIGLWVYVASDIFWCIAEYDCWRDPSTNSLAKAATFGYTVCMTLLALTVAITAILFLTNPLLTFPLLLTSSCICALLGVVGFSFWVQSWIMSPQDDELAIVKEIVVNDCNETNISSLHVIHTKSLWLEPILKENSHYAVLPQNSSNLHWR